MERILSPRTVWGLLLNSVFALSASGGGSGLNTLIVVNQFSSNSCELGNYYCAVRGVPPDNVLRIAWPGTNTLWTSNDFENLLLEPLLDMLAARQLTNQIDYVVLSMDIPFQTRFGTRVNSTTSALFYGSRQGDGSDPEGIANSYAASEASFRLAKPAGAPGYSFLTTMMTAASLAQAKGLVDQGVESDGSFPQQPVILAKTTDTARNVRHVYFDNAIFDVNILGAATILRTNTDSIWWPGGCSGHETGLSQFDVPQNAFVPGAVADSLTSFGGVIFGPNSQTNLLAFIHGGAAGSYGTVDEPLADTQKFPSPHVYFYQSRGFSLAESYYQSINAPYLGLIVAEPLAAPFSRSGFGQWSTSLSNAVLHSITNLSLEFVASTGNLPLQQVDLFVDGKFHSTLTNLPPRAGNVLEVSLNGYLLAYMVPTNATLETVAADLAALINTATDATQVKAAAFGDRIELQCIATDLLTVPYYVADSTPANTPGLSYRATYLSGSFPPQMKPLPPEPGGAFAMELGIPTTLPYVIEASTNLASGQDSWRSVFTNSAPPGLLKFVDHDATNYPMRYYRMTWPSPDQPAELSAPSITVGGAMQLHVNSVPGLPWEMQISTNLVDWTPIHTNQLGGAADFVDLESVTAPCRFYRTMLLPPGSPDYAVIPLATNLTLVRVDEAAGPYAVEVTTNPGQWTLLEAIFAKGGIKTASSSAKGNAGSLTTFLMAPRPELMPSRACGTLWFSQLRKSIPANSWIQFTITKTNGQVVHVAVTNEIATNSGVLAAQLYQAINAAAALQTEDGVVAEDYTVEQFGSFTFTTFSLYARSPGLEAAAIQVDPSVSPQVPAFGSGGQTLTQNLPDLAPRNHLYVSAGASDLALTFPFDTTTLPDGHHELTVVAYEGSNVRTQTRVSARVEVQNSSLSASLTLLDQTNAAPVLGTCHVAVDSNAIDPRLITLYSTGGVLAAATNQPAAVFEVQGTNLWAGLHPFYALVETYSGLKYRTDTKWFRFTGSP